MKVHIPTPLRQYAGKSDTVEVPGKTVREALANLTAKHSELRPHLYTENGKLRAFVNVYVNEEDIRYMQKEDTPLTEGDSISIVPSIAGGCDELKKLRIYEVSGLQSGNSQILKFVNPMNFNSFANS